MFCSAPPPPTNAPRPPQSISPQAAAPCRGPPSLCSSAVCPAPRVPSFRAQYSRGYLQPALDSCVTAMYPPVPPAFSFAFFSHSPALLRRPALHSRCPCVASQRAVERRRPLPPDSAPSGPCTPPDTCCHCFSTSHVIKDGSAGRERRRARSTRSKGELANWAAARRQAGRGCSRPRACHPSKRVCVALWASGPRCTRPPPLRPAFPPPPFCRAPPQPRQPCISVISSRGRGGSPGRPPSSSKRPLSGCSPLPAAPWLPHDMRRSPRSQRTR